MPISQGAGYYDIRREACGDRLVYDPFRFVARPFMGIRRMSDAAVIGGMGSQSKSIPSSDKPSSLPPNLLPSAPASPPTPAPSPTPHQRPTSWRPNDQEEDTLLSNIKFFESLSGPRRQQFLESILGLCNSQQLSFVSSYVAPRLRKDPFTVFPTEISLRVSWNAPYAFMAHQKLTLWFPN